MSSSMRDLLLVAAAGAIGAAARYLIGRVMGPTADVTFP